MGDTAGELPDRLHLLRLAQLQFQPPPLHHVDRRSDDASLSVQRDQLAGKQVRSSGSVAGDEIRLHTGISPGQDLLRRLAQQTSVFALEEIQRIHRGDLFAGEAADVLDIPVPAQQVPFLVEQVEQPR